MTGPPPCSSATGPGPSSSSWRPTGTAPEGANRFLGWDFGVDATAYSLLQAQLGGTITMEGREVYRRAVRATVDSACAALERAGCSPGDVDLFVPHQANRRIIEAVAERIGIPLERTAVTVDRTGNTSAASIPLALAEAAAAGRIGDGDTVLVSGFGAGMTWASAVFRWGTAPGSAAVPSHSHSPPRPRDPRSHRDRHRGDAGRQGGPDHRGVTRHRPGLRPMVSRAGRPGGGDLPLGGGRGGARGPLPLRSPATSRTPTQVEAAFAAVEESVGPRGGPGGQRRHAATPSSCG